MSGLDARIPPPIVAAIVAGSMWGVDAAVHGPMTDFPTREPLAIALFALGIVTAAAGVVEFRRARTTLDPLHPEKAAVIVERGIFRYTRNPMYLGLTIVLTAFAVHLVNPLTLFGPILFVAYMNRFQIGPEERALGERFGAAFDDYRRRVRRWL